MPCRASAAIILGIVGTREKMNIFIDRIRVIPKLFVAIPTVEIIRKQMLLTIVVLRRAALGLRLDLLYPFKRRSVDDRLVDVLEDHPVIGIIR